MEAAKAAAKAAAAAAAAATYKFKLCLFLSLLFLSAAYVGSRIVQTSSSSSSSSSGDMKTYIVDLLPKSGTRSESLSKDSSSSSSSGDMKTYIINLLPKSGSESLSKDDRVKWYKSLLPPDTVTTDEQGMSRSSSRLIYVYHGLSFAARLTEAELEQIKKMDEFLSADPDRIFHIPDISLIRDRDISL